MTPTQKQLLAAAKGALRWFDNRERGTALNGQYDDIIIARDLAVWIQAVEQEEKQRWTAGVAEVVERR